MLYDTSKTSIANVKERSDRLYVTNEVSNAKATNVNVAAMKRAVLIVERDVKMNFTKQGTYRKYRRRKKKGKDEFHFSSRPGEPPAIDTGDLRASIGNEVIKSSSFVDGLVGDTENLKYAPMLELGTRNMQPRPYLRPSLKRMRKQINKIFKEANGD